MKPIFPFLFIYYQQFLHLFLLFLFSTLLSFFFVQMTVLKFSTHVTSDPLYSDQGISFKVIFGERPVFCFTNRADVVSSIMGLGLSLGDSIEMTGKINCNNTQYISLLIHISFFFNEKKLPC
jgi:hypothetical protein